MQHTSVQKQHLGRKGFVPQIVGAEYVIYTRSNLLAVVVAAIPGYLPAIGAGLIHQLPMDVGNLDPRIGYQPFTAI